MAVGAVLIVEDYPEMARALVRAATEAGLTPRVATSVAAAKEYVSSSAVADLRAAVIDVGLPDGDGMALAREVNAALPWVSVLVLTGQTDLSLAGEATGFGACFAHKPIEDDQLSAFLCRAQIRATTPRVARALVAYARECELTPQEVAMVRLWLDGGRTVTGVCAELGIAEATVKSHVSHILRKCKEARAHGVVRAILERALLLD